MIVRSLIISNLSMAKCDFENSAVFIGLYLAKKTVSKEVTKTSQAIQVQFFRIFIFCSGIILNIIRAKLCQINLVVKY